MPSFDQQLPAPRIQMEAWMNPGDHLSMDEAETKIRALGHEILERDDAGRRFLVGYNDSEADRPDRACEDCGYHQFSTRMRPERISLCDDCYARRNM